MRRTWALSGLRRMARLAVPGSVTLTLESRILSMQGFRLLVCLPTILDLQQLPELVTDLARDVIKVVAVDLARVLVVDTFKDFVLNFIGNEIGGFDPKTFRDHLGDRDAIARPVSPDLSGFN